jgi:hypothetical protein
MNRDQKRIKRLKQDLKFYKEQYEYANKEMREIERDRQKFRDWLTHDFQWMIRLNKEGNTPSLPWLIEQYGKRFTQAKPWTWL